MTDRFTSLYGRFSFFSFAYTISIQNVAKIPPLPQYRYASVRDTAVILVRNHGNGILIIEESNIINCGTLNFGCHNSFEDILKRSEVY